MIQIFNIYDANSYVRNEMVSFGLIVTGTEMEEKVVNNI